MLQPDDQKSEIQVYGYLVAVEMATTAKVTPEQVGERLAESLNWLEGVGQVEVENLGVAQLEEIVEEVPPVSTLDKKEMN